MIRTALSLLSPGGQRGRLTILIFHRVLPEIDPLFPDEPDARRFDEMLTWVKAWFNVLPLDTAIQQLRAGQLPPRAAAITFDDGYADNRTIATPILQRHGLSATFFIATGFLDGGRMWNDSIIEAVRGAKATVLDLTRLGLGAFPNQTIQDKRTAIDQIIAAIKYRPIDERVEITNALFETLCVPPTCNLMMTSSQVREMRDSGMLIGAHTVSHPILAKTHPATARQEIADSKARLEALLNQPVTLFAYPNGKPGTDYCPEHATLVRDLGFTAAVSTAWGAANALSDPFQLPRFTPWDRHRTGFGIRLIRNLISGAV